MLILILIKLVSCEFNVTETYTQAHIDRFEEGMRKHAPDLEVVPCWKEKCVAARSNIPLRGKVIYLPFEETMSELDPCLLDFNISVQKQCYYINLIYKKYLDESLTFLTSAVRLFPISFDTPMYWSQADLEYYNRTSLWKKQFDPEGEHARLHKNFIRDNAQLADDYPVLFELEAWKWARSIILSRGFRNSLDKFHHVGYHLNIEDKVPSPRYSTILPIFDMLNHDSIRKGDNSSKLFEFNQNPPAIHYRAMRSFQKNKEVYNYYGDYNNHRLISHYGFSFKQNTHDNFDIYPLAFKKCTGSLKKDKCYFSLDNHKPNLDFYLILLEEDHKISVKLKHILDKLFNQKLNLNTLSVQDLSTLQSGNVLYRKRLTEFYRETDSISFRELRRTYIGKEKDFKPIITDFAETERLLYFRHLNLIDNACLTVAYHWLFS